MIELHHSGNPVDPGGKPVIILNGDFAGQEGICLGVAPDERRWAVSPDSSAEILYLEYFAEFAILLNKGQEPNNS